MEINVYCKDGEGMVEGIFPKPLRCLIVGSSGCGKTNLLLNFIYNKDGVTFKHLYIFSRSIEQPAYVELRKHYESVEKTLKNADKIAYFFSDCNNLVSLDECKPSSLVVFDDCLLDEQSKIKDYYIRGRHKNISCVYLSQSYGRVDMQVIRNNVNLLCVFQQNKHYTKRIHEDFVGSDIALREFEKLCRRCWKEPHGFVSINTTRKVRTGKYKCMLNKTVFTHYV